MHIEFDKKKSNRASLLGTYSKLGNITYYREKLHNISRKEGDEEDFAQIDRNESLFSTQFMKF